jgi:hypothetical protein
VNPSVWPRSFFEASRLSENRTNGAMYGLATEAQRLQGDVGGVQLVGQVPFSEVRR